MPARSPTSAPPSCSQERHDDGTAARQPVRVRARGLPRLRADQQGPADPSHPADVRRERHVRDHRRRGADAGGGGQPLGRGRAGGARADPGHHQRGRWVPGHRPDARELRGSPVTITDLTALLALGSIALFVVGLKRLSRVRTARSGNALMASGMLLAVVITLLEMGLVDYRWIVGGLAIGGGIGVAIVLRAQATEMPEIVARFNGFGGASSALVALSLFWIEVVELPGGAAAAETMGGT